MAWNSHHDEPWLFCLHRPRNDTDAVTQSGSQTTLDNVPTEGYSFWNCCANQALEFFFGDRSRSISARRISSSNSSRTYLACICLRFKPSVLVIFDANRLFDAHRLLEDLLKAVTHADFTSISLSFEPSTLTALDPNTQLSVTVLRFPPSSWAASSMSLFFDPSRWHQQKRNRFHVQNSSCLVDSMCAIQVCNTNDCTEPDQTTGSGEPTPSRYSPA